MSRVSGEAEGGKRNGDVRPTDNRFALAHMLACKYLTSRTAFPLRESRCESTSKVKNHFGFGLRMTTTPLS
jgi:hypothetical protein